MIRITKTFRFEASHVLPNHPGKCSRLHGHSWTGWLTLEGSVDPLTGFVCDFADVSVLIKECITDLYDHQHLGYGGLTNPITGVEYSATLGTTFYPTSENLVFRIAQDVNLNLVAHKEKYGELTRLVEVGLSETCTSSAIWRPGDKSPEWLRYGV